MSGHGGGHGGRRRGSGHVEEHENHERWMVTYADMLTLLLVLFIVLYAISSLNVSKFDQLKSSLSSAFNGGSKPSVIAAGNGLIAGQSQAEPVDVGPKGPNFKSATTGTATKAAQAEDNQFEKIKASIDATLKAKGLAGSARYTINERGLVVSVLTNAIVFQPDSPTLEPGGKTILDAITPTLKTVNNKIEVDGNVNQLPSPVDGWALSTERALQVRAYLDEHGGVAGSRFSGVNGQGPNVPLVDPKDSRAADLNRRVDIVVLTNYSAADRAGLFTPSASSSSATASATTTTK